MLLATITRTSGPVEQQESTSGSWKNLPTVPSRKAAPNVRDIWVEIFAWFESPNTSKSYCPSRGLSYDAFVGNNKNWCTFRLVCRSWAEIAGPPRHMALANINSRLHVKVRSIDFSRIVVDRTSGESQFLRLTKGTHICPNLTSISLVDATVVTLRPTPQSNSKAITRVDFFLDNAQSFTTVRSLCLHFNGNHFNAPHLWSRLQKGYPLLIDLAVYGLFPVQFTDEISFKNLESLVFSHIYMQETPVFRLPSIKHLSILSNRFSLSQVLNDYGFQLETLTILARERFEGEFWSEFWSYLPNLLNLDIQYLALSAIHAVPHAHPLQQLCVHSLPCTGQQVDMIRHILEKCPRVPDLRISDIMISDSMKELISPLADKNNAVITTSTIPVAPNPPKHRRPRTRRPGTPIWITILFVISLPFLAMAYLIYELIAWLYGLVKGSWGLCLSTFRRRQGGSRTDSTVGNV